MRAGDGIILAASMLMRRKLRAFLCILSVGVGVASMVLIVSIGMCGQEQVRQRIGRLGLSGLAIYAAQSTGGQSMTQMYAEKIKENVPAVSHAIAIKTKNGSYRTATASGNAIFFGVTEELGQVVNLQLLAGVLPSPRQVKNGEPVVVIDDQLAKELYGRENIVGKKLRLTVSGVEGYYRVIGIVKAQSSALGAFVANIAPAIIYLPYSCLADTSESVDQIMVQCMAEANTTETGEQITDFLIHRGRISGEIKVQDMSGLLGQLEGATQLVTLLFLIVASISFFVAMLGVLSGMLAAAHEKKGEIGLYMALGARKLDIIRLFLVQAILISVSGGVMGLMTSVAALVITQQVLHLVLAVPLVFTFAVLGLSAFCGALAGVLPAIHAANLHPVEAMRK